MTRKKTDGAKQDVIAQLIQAYEIKDATDLQEALKDLLGGTLESMLKAEMNAHLGYNKYETSENPNSRNGYKQKTVRSSLGETVISVPQDRDSSFEPQVVQKRQKDISEIENKIISMYALGMTTRQISDQINEIYGFQANPSLISDITDKILPEIEEWQNRALAQIYPVVYIDAIHFSVKEEGAIIKKAAYVVLGLDEDGYKDVLGIYIGQNESAKFWLGVLNNIKARGVEHIFIICSDALSGIKESIEAAYPKTVWQRCIVHQVRNTVKYVSYKDRKEYAKDLKTIYHAINEEVGMKNMLEVKIKWDARYPGSMDSWENNWASIVPIFNYSSQVRKIIYTTNAIESLNISYRRLNRGRAIFPTDMALLKALYLATKKITEKWTMPQIGWGKIIKELK
ncbi:MAG: IS256 family transposase, partial [Treponema sp.]|nr:IS256 family transposase [Treponema sp.]